jgi:A/G-specific adenine glycosylase
MINKNLSSSLRKSFCSLLLEWWEKNKRDFPWRRTSDSYALLIAELLLRKTTAKQVERAYKAFLARYPDPESLSTASEAEIGEL